eukprot:15328526-Ditylum_brightwellii.AAC.1
MAFGALMTSKYLLEAISPSEKFLSPTIASAGSKSALNTPLVQQILCYLNQLPAHCTWTIHRVKRDTPYFSTIMIRSNARVTTSKACKRRYTSGLASSPQLKQCCLWLCLIGILIKRITKCTAVKQEIINHLADITLYHDWLSPPLSSLVNIQ